jgi:hypothetical protein
MLKKYLDNMTTYAEIAYAGSIPESNSEGDDGDLSQSGAGTVVANESPWIAANSNIADTPESPSDSGRVLSTEMEITRATSGGKKTSQRAAGFPSVPLKTPEQNHSSIFYGFPKIPSWSNSKISAAEKSQEL